MTTSYILPCVVAARADVFMHVYDTLMTCKCRRK